MMVLLNDFDGFLLGFVLGLFSWVVLSLVWCFYLLSMIGWKRFKMLVLY